MTGIVFPLLSLSVGTGIFATLNFPVSQLVAAWKSQMELMTKGRNRHNLYKAIVGTIVGNNHDDRL